MTKVVKKDTFKIDNPLNLDRTNLIEGRTSGMEFSVVIPTNDPQVFKMVTPFTCCKDYFNDVVFKINTGFDIKVYGFDTTIVTDDLLKSEYVYMAIRERDKPLKYNKELMQKFINLFEDAYLRFIGHGTTIISNDDVLICIGSIKYFSSTYLVSLWTFIIRISQYYNDQSIEDFIDYVNKTYPIESTIINRLKIWLNFVNFKLLPDLSFLGMEDFNNFDYKTENLTIHNAGLCNFRF